MNIILRNEAKGKGLKFFFTGKPCSRGHVSERRAVNGVCVSCEQEERNRNQKANSARFRERHKDEFREYQRNWYHANKESATQTRKKYVENNYEKVKELRNKNNKMFRETNPEYHSAWWKNNKSKAVEYGKRDYAKQARRRWNKNNRGLKNYHTRCRQKQIIQATPRWADQEQIRKLYIAAALLSERSGEEYHVDHIIPLHHEQVCGLHVNENLRIITKTENLKKGNQLIFV